MEKQGQEYETTISKLKDEYATEKEEYETKIKEMREEKENVAESTCRTTQLQQDLTVLNNRLTEWEQVLSGRDIALTKKQSEYDALKHEYENEQNEQSLLQSRIMELETVLGRSTAALKSVEVKRALLQSRYDDLHTSLTAVQTNNDELTQHVKQMQDSIDTVHQAMEQMKFCIGGAQCS